MWDYPRPPKIEADHRPVRVQMGELLVARTTQSARVLETSHPPVFYIPPVDVDLELLVGSDRRTFCEYKGEARYWDLIADVPTPSVAWSYPNPTRRYLAIRDWFAFYPSKVACFVDGERVESQEGGFYGGWITGEIEGPFKGAPGTLGW